LGRLATDAGVFPLYEVTDGRLTITRKLGTPKPIEEYLKAHGGFRHLNAAEAAEVEAQVRENWAQLLEREKADQG